MAEGPLEVREIIIRVRGAEQVSEAYRDISADAGKAAKSTKAIGDEAQRSAGKAHGFGERASGALKGIAVAAAAAGAAVAGMFVRSGFEALLAEEKGTAALTAVMKDAKAAQAEIVKLRELAELPGIDFTGAIQLSAQLQAVGMTAEQARQALAVLSNGVVASGGDFASLQEVVRSVSSAIGRGVLEEEDLKEIRARIFSVGTYFQQTGATSAKAWAEAAGGAKNAYLQLFGWMDQNIAKVEGGLSVQLENLKIAATEVAKGFAKGLVGGGAMSDMESFTANVGVLAGNAEQLGKAIGAMMPGLKALAKIMLSAAYALNMSAYWLSWAPGGGGAEERERLKKENRRIEEMYGQMSRDAPEATSGRGRLMPGELDAANRARQEAIGRGATPGQAADAAMQAAEAYRQSYRAPEAGAAGGQMGARLGEVAANGMQAVAGAMDRRMQRESRRLAAEAG